MPNTSSAKKALRQSKKRYIRNRSVKQRIKRRVKRFLELIKEGNKEKATEAFRIITKLYDKAAKRNIVHKNKANRKKSVLQKKLSAL